ALELSGLARDPIPVWLGEEMRRLSQGDVLRFYTDGKGVSAQTEEGVSSVRLRLYELEERLDPRRFVRISNSEIVNLDKVTALDLSLAGTIRLTLNGTTAVYVSRRYVKRMKETLGLGRGSRK
ncbi:MAG: LytTR family DNA-binding domain-containing protein, partial [Lawsonibacter sp.]|nr:LytTR family DNA-binding domain-containing protein [Lawsonibacter sp.]